MPIQAPSWTDFLFCPICCNEFAVNQRLPISLGCGHTICRQCLSTLHNRQCPFDQTSITTDVDNLPINNALLQLVSTNTNTNASTTNNSSNNPGSTNNNNNNNGIGIESGSGGGATGAASCDSGDDATNTNAARHTPPSVRQLSPEDLLCYKLANKCIESLALYLKSLVCNVGNGNFGSPLSRPMQRKLVTLVNTQLMEREGRDRVLRAARSLGERTVTELILQHQNPQQLSSNLWAAVRSRGCQFLGPAMQEEVLKLVLQALEDGTAYSRKVLVMYVVQRLEPRFPQASKTSIGHVVQLLYRASCFKVSKREADSSLMQLKEEFRTYDTLRREHDAQIVQIATEAGLRIAPDQWSALLYGDTVHKSHMQSIIDKLQTPSSFAQSVQELLIALQRTGDPANLSSLRAHLKLLAGIDPSLESPSPSWLEVAKALEAVHEVVGGLVDFVQHHGNRKLQDSTANQASLNSKYKISLCRDLTVRRNCPRGSSCTFAHSEEELEKYRAKNRKTAKPVGGGGGGDMHAVSGIGLDPMGSGGAVQPSGFISHNHAHTSNNHTHNPRAIHMLHPPNDTSTPVSAATSPMRFGCPPQQPPTNMHNKLQRGNYTPDVAASAATAGTAGGVGGGPHYHHHMRGALHPSPIPPQNNAQNTSRYGPTAFGAPLNYPMPPPAPGLPPRMQSQVNVASSSAPPMTMRNATGDVISPRNFPATLQPRSAALSQLTPNMPPPPPPMLPGKNPPKYHNNNNNNNDNVAMSLASPLTSKSIYNLLHPEIYNSAIIGMNNNSGNGNNNNNNNTRSSPSSAASLFSNNYNHNNNRSVSNMGDGEAGNMLNVNNSLEIKLNLGPPSEKCPAPLPLGGSMWEQQHRNLIGKPTAINVGDIINSAAIGGAAAGMEGSPAHQSTMSLYHHHPTSLPPTSGTVASMFGGRKINSNSNNNKNNTNNMGMDLSKTLNELGIGDSYSIFQNDFAIVGNNTVSLPVREPARAANAALWHANSNNNVIGATAAGFADNTQERSNSMACAMGIHPSAKSSFRDRNSFVRSDSILDDDAATFEVPTTSTTAAAGGNKFGPICPMYKGFNSSSSSSSSNQSSTAIDVVNSSTYLDSWCASGSSSCGGFDANRNLNNHKNNNNNYNNTTLLNNEHPLLERNSMCGASEMSSANYSVFSNDVATPGLALQFQQQQQHQLQQQQQQQQQQRRLKNHQNQNQQQLHQSSVFDNFNSALLSDLPFNQIANLTTTTGKVESGSAIDSANFELGFNAFQNMLADADDSGNIDLNKTSAMWNSDLREIETNFWQNALTNKPTTKSKELQMQRHQQQQQYHTQQLLNIANKNRNSEETTTIDIGRMRDIEQELSEIVDKSWSNADDSGIKL